MDMEDDSIESDKFNNLKYEFFKSIETGEVSTVTEFFKSVNDLESIINVEDDFGYTALALSIKQQNEDLMKLLTSNGADAGDALLIAVDVEFKNGIKMLYNIDRTLINLAVLSKHFQFGTTPLMVACHNNSYDLIEYLFSLGAFPIDQDSSSFGQDGLQRSLYRLSVFKAICSPSYIMITHPDPLYQAFKMRTETHRLSVVDEELSEEYQLLTEKCERFSEEYLSCVATDKELVCLLSMNNPNVDNEVTRPGGPVTRIMYAINTDQKKFVAHRFCQQAIDEAFTGNIPWRGQNMLVKIIISLIGVLILPFYWIVNIFLPPNVSWMHWFEVPLLKFASAFVGFVLLAIITSINCINTTSWSPNDSEDPSQYEAGSVSEYGEWLCNMYVFAWLIGRFLEFLLQVLSLGLNSVWGDTWSRYDMLTMLLFAISTLMYWSGGSEGGEYGSLHNSSVQAYEICFALGTLLVLNRSIYWVGVTESLGKLNILLGFAFGIIIKFFLIFFIFQFSFAVAINSLLWKENIIFALECVTQEPAVLPTSTQDSVVYGFHQCYSEIWGSNVKQFTDVIGSLWVTFWALSGSVDYQLINKLYTGNYNVPVAVALILWVVYCVLGVLIFLNILIGLMFKTMERLEGNVEVEFKCDNAQMLIPFIAGGINPVPPPFNIIPRVSHFYLIMEIIKTRLLKTKKTTSSTMGGASGSGAAAAAAESSKITLTDVKEMLQNVKTRWRRGMTSSGSNDCATGEQVKEIECWIRKKMTDLDTSVDKCEFFLDAAYKRV